MRWIVPNSSKLCCNAEAALLNYQTDQNKFVFFVWHWKIYSLGKHLGAGFYIVG